jgi:hypothetical protein
MKRAADSLLSCVVKRQKTEHVVDALGAINTFPATVVALPAAAAAIAKMSVPVSVCTNCGGTHP